MSYEKQNLRISCLTRNQKLANLIACVASVSVGSGSKELQRENGARKRRRRGEGKEGKKTLEADKPLDFENRPHAQ